MSDPREVQVIRIRAADLRVGERFRVEGGEHGWNRPKWRLVTKIDVLHDGELEVWWHGWEHWSTGGELKDWHMGLSPHDLIEVQV